MGPDGAVNILFKKEIEKSQTPEERRKELQSDYREKFANPYRAAELGYVDEVILLISIPSALPTVMPNNP